MIILLSGVMFSAITYAECNTTLPYQELIDCIRVEGSGVEDYKQWEQGRKKEMQEALYEYKELAEKSKQALTKRSD